MSPTFLRNLLCGIFLVTSNVACAQDKVMLCTGKSSHSYHKEYCRGLKRCGSTVITVTKKEAIKAGKDACDFCYGHGADNAQKTNTNQRNPLYSLGSGSKSTSSQCAAITKKGSQCSRSATSNGYCWQHAK